MEFYLSKVQTLPYLLYQNRDNIDFTLPWNKKDEDKIEKEDTDRMQRKADIESLQHRKGDSIPMRAEIVRGTSWKRRVLHRK